MGENHINQKDLIERAVTSYKEERYQDAFADHLTLAETGLTSSQIFLGWMYMVGKGTHRDLDQAEHWFTLASEAGSAVALFELGNLAGKKKDYETALQWYEKSAEHGYLPAIYRLAVRYEDGNSVDQDKLKAYHLFQKAAEKGHLRSQRTYARRLILGSEGLAGIPRGVVMLIRFLGTGFAIGLKDQSDERFRY